MKQAELLNKVVAAVRIRGTVNVRGSIAETLSRLHLKHPNNCTIIKVNVAYLGMLKKCSNHIAYGEVEEGTLSKLLTKGGMKTDAKSLMDGKADAKELKEFLPVRLHPPKHGYKSTKLNVKQGGSLGYMEKKDLSSLINRMV